ncbi:Splicing factor, suppressor of white-apricot [Gossypium australe]|uniref:Splicing factor, suppressor of white-apricot n=1 Tax=Gossypium australe TaxID=47621 RepID=A0A5B6UWM0_9ROSI|nr:Splicing factor, suppressor of white-apricot [Gossypium australe]
MSQICQVREFYFITMDMVFQSQLQMVKFGYLIRGDSIFSPFCWNISLCSEAVANNHFRTVSNPCLHLDKSFGTPSELAINQDINIWKDELAISLLSFKRCLMEVSWVYELLGYAVCLYCGWDGDNNEEPAAAFGLYNAVSFSYGNTGESNEQKDTDVESSFRPPFPVPETLLQNLYPKLKSKTSADQDLGWWVTRRIV